MLPSNAATEHPRSTHDVVAYVWSGAQDVSTWPCVRMASYCRQPECVRPGGPTVPLAEQGCRRRAMGSETLAKSYLLIAGGLRALAGLVEPSISLFVPW